jgi:peptidoglycan/xylan/chitin deacetylase (PgdA/CDA1 family)/GT2 family glycosyltransferase
VRYVRQENQGLAAARNTGLRHSSGDYLIFLDADDWLLPQAVELGLRQFQAHPECAFVSGHINMVTSDGWPLPGPDPFLLGSDPYVDLLQDNRVSGIMTVLFRRAVFDAVGVFDPSLKACEDYDLYLRIARQYLVCSHSAVVAEYRQHGANMSRDSALMLRSAITVLRRQWRFVQGNAQRTAAYSAGLRFWRHCYGRQLAADVRAQMAAGECRRALQGLAVLLRDPILLLDGALTILSRQRRPAQVLLRRHGQRFANQVRRLSRSQVVPPKQIAQRRLDRGTARLRWQEPRGLILLYHRIVSTPTDPWALNVTPDHFAEHLQVLESYGDPVSLPRLLERIQDRGASDRMIAVTFDDGYPDNVHTAKPLLERFSVPATVFVTVGALEEPTEFWWDELDGLLLQPGTLPDALQLQVNRRCLTWKLGDAAQYTESDFERLSSWRAWENPPGARQALYRSLWELLRRLPVDDREQVLDALRTWAGTGRIRRPTHRCLSCAEALALMDEPWVTLGAHTLSHPSLAMLTVDAQRNEIEHSRSRLTDLIGHPVSAFAYPFGKRSDFTAETLAIVRNAGFTNACTNIAGLVKSSTDCLHLPRFAVYDWDGDEFSRQLSAWFND